MRDNGKNFTITCSASPNRRPYLLIRGTSFSFTIFWSTNSNRWPWLLMRRTRLSFTIVLAQDSSEHLTVVIAWSEELKFMIDPLFFIQFNACILLLVIFCSLSWILEWVSWLPFIVATFSKNISAQSHISNLFRVRFFKPKFITGMLCSIVLSQELWDAPLFAATCSSTR